ncbi:MAG: hypothetical protein J0H89_07190, partial [Rhizobiales bacterium]|nr:hypothetical protein [Hyphomicrobiales bacterium]
MQKLRVNVRSHIEYAIYGVSVNGNDNENLVILHRKKNAGGCRCAPRARLRYHDGGARIPWSNPDPTELPRSAGLSVANCEASGSAPPPPHRSGQTLDHAMEKHIEALPYGGVALTH